MTLSERQLKERIIVEPSVIKEARDWWKKGSWDKIENRILIDPFEPENLGLTCYDLSVGEEYVSLRDPDTVKKLKEGEVISIDPSETVLVLTYEYAALPKNVTGIIIPRARWIFEGSLLSATRIDPTWYGKMLVGFTNLTKSTILLGFRKTFCTCIFLPCNDVEGHLTKKDVPFLGRTAIDSLTFAFARPRQLMRAQEFTREQFDTVVKSFGYPWDVVQCAIEKGREETIHYIEKDVAPRMVEEATLKVTERAYKELFALHKQLTNVLMGLVITVAAGVISAVILAVLHFI